MTTAPRVLTLIGGLDGSAMWRAIQPAEELQRQGHVAHWDYNRSDGLALAVARYRYDMVVLERLSWSRAELPQAREYVDSLHRAGIMVVGAYDDDAWLAIDEHLSGEDEREQMERNRESLHTLRLLDGVIVSTQRLRTIVSTLTDAPVAVVPNLIDLSWFRAVQAEAVRVVKPLTIGWYGTKRQDSDLEALGEAWARIAARFPRVRFVIAGHVSPVVAGRVPADRLTTIPYLPLDSYPLGLVNIDIGCASVADNRFNRAKSIIKALEYGARGRTAVVATPTLYREIIRDGDTGLLAETADEWEAALARLVEDAALRRALARRLGREVESKYSLQSFAWRWLEAWDSLITQHRERERGKVQIWTPGKVA